MKYKNLIKVGLAPLLVISIAGCNREPDDGKVTMTFQNYNGDVISTQRVERGTVARYEGEIPTMEKRGKELANIFIGWDKELTALTRNTVFTAQYKTINKFIDKDHDGMPEGIDPNDDPNDPNSNYFEVGAKSMVYLDQNIKIDFSKFLEDEANTKYDNNLAKLGLFLSNPKIDFKDGLFTDKAYGSRINALYARLGFDDYHFFDFKDYAAKNYKYDPFDTTSGVYGHKYLFDSDGNVVKDLITIAFEGTNGKNRWASNFDVGYHDDMYYKKAKRSDKDYEDGTAADHPEWTDKRYHKGFYVAAKRVLATEIQGNTEKLAGPVKFLEYVKKHSTKSNGKPIIFITGHSRGGAMANIIGEYFEKDYKEKLGKECIPFTYAFASPAIWGDESRISTQTIFNVINSDDIVTKVPFSDWGFTRFGDKDYSKSVYDEYKKLYDNNVEKREYQRIEGGDSIFRNLGTTGRKQIYDLELKTESGDPDTKYMSNIKINNEESFNTQDEAQAKIDNETDGYNKYYKEKLGDLFNFIKLKPVQNLLGTAWDVYADCCLGTITVIAQKLMTGDKLVMQNIKELVPLIMNKKFIEFAASIGVNILAAGADTIKLPHDYGAYHIILREYGKEPNNK